jgi:predicted TIM-barrel fold metal-dependent hydrolase
MAAKIRSRVRSPRITFVGVQQTGSFMHRIRLSSLLAAITIACAHSARQAPSNPEQVRPPIVDHHQHFFSEALAALVNPNPAPPGATVVESFGADSLIAMLDSAGIQRALVLALGYSWGRPGRNVENEYEKVKAENDWVAAEVARYPDRLRAFCSFNPLRDYALTELARCAAHPQLRNGLKLHIGNARVDYHDARHLAQLREVFRDVNARRMPIVIHMRASISAGFRYGREEARIFFDSILPAAPDIPVQIAHLAGAGGFDATADSALSVFVEAIARKDPRASNLWFDVTTVDRGVSPAGAQLIATRIRQLGIDRVLWGSDAATGGNLPPAKAWAEFRKIPLTAAEFQTIATNVAPYLQ